MNVHLRRYGTWGALALLLGALALTYLRASRYDAASYFENVALLRQIKQLDARWELDAMKSRIGLNHNYDPLVDSLPEMARLPERLTGGAQQGQQESALAAAIAAYQQAHLAKVALMESFKSHNAVLQNSRAFLRTAQEDLDALDGHAAANAAAVGNQVLLDTLVYAQSPSAEQALQVETRLAALAKASSTLDETGRERSELFAAHVRTVLRERVATDRLLDRIAEAPTAARIDDIGAELGTLQHRALQQLQLYRLALSVLAVLLVAMLAAAALRLIRNHATIHRVNQQLHQANLHLEQRVEARTAELLQANGRLRQEMAERKQLECRLLQSEKLASIGQLAAGIAHEINNPLAFLAANFSMLEEHLESLFEILGVYEAAESCIASAEMSARLNGTRARIDLDYLKADLPALVAESRGGMDRVGKIVQNLKDFSHVESEQAWEWSDLRNGLQSTLNLMTAELQPVADVVTDYGPVLEVECLPSQLNQAFMSILMNAAQAIGPQRGRITVRTGGGGGEVWVEIGDDGHGIAADVLPRIFDPFFSTRGIGKGTGLGLSLAYGIVTQHRGRIDVQTLVGQGSTFRVTLPISQRTVAA
jgi:signal transduction histidine kinase